MTASLALSASRAAPTAWRRHLAALAVAWGAILLLFRRDAADMVLIWWNSSTFNHCLLILPIIFWLVRARWPDLVRLQPAAWPPALTIPAAGAFLWLLGDAGGVALARHLGLVVMMQGAAIVLLGATVSRCLAFPIFYALFLVPAGEELVPAMQTLTAIMVTFLLSFSGFPAHVDGIFITTPRGLFEVAEACAGVKFLIAMAALAALVANVCFRSWRRRVLFLVIALAVPVLANAVRAWATIVVAQHRGVDSAAGFDHVIYGGVFFAVVIALILGGAWRHFDRRVDDPWFDPEAQPVRTGPPPTPVAAVLLLLCASPWLWSAGIAMGASSTLPANFALPQVAGWQRISTSSDWRPAFRNADIERIGTYRNDAGQQVDLAVIVYARQEEGRELLGFGQGAAGPGWTWAGRAPSLFGGRAERIASAGVAREVVSFYRVGNIVTGSDVGAKIETMKVRLLGGNPAAAALLVSARSPASGISPRPAIQSFLRSLGPVERIADSARGED